MKFGTAGWTFHVGQLVFYELPDHIDPEQRGKRRVGCVNMLAIPNLGSLGVLWRQSVDAGAFGNATVRTYNDDGLPSLINGCPNYIMLPFDELVPMAEIL